MMQQRYNEFIGASPEAQADTINNILGNGAM